LFYLFYNNLIHRIISFFPWYYFFYWIPSNGFELDWTNWVPVIFVVTTGDALVFNIELEELKFPKELFNVLFHDVLVECVATLLLDIIGSWKVKLEDGSGDVPNDNGLISLEEVPNGLLKLTGLSLFNGVLNGFE